MSLTMHRKRVMMQAKNSRRVDRCPKREVHFGDATLQRTRSDGQAFKPTRGPPAHRRASCVLPSFIQRLQSPSRTGIRPRNPISKISDQLPAAAFARARWLHATRKAFISARSSTICLATPLYFFVIPVTVRMTAPRWTRPWSFS
jgi:hypothetical protein